MGMSVEPELSEADLAQARCTAPGFSHLVLKLAFLRRFLRGQRKGQVRKLVLIRGSKCENLPECCLYMRSRITCGSLFSPLFIGGFQHLFALCKC